MLRDQMINLLETALVMLTLTNAVSIAVAAYAISFARRMMPTELRPAAEYGLLGFLTRCLRIRA